MAVESVKAPHERYTEPFFGQDEIVEKYTVTGFADPSDFLTSSVIPKRWDAHPNEADYLVVKREMAPYRNPDQNVIFEVTITYRVVKPRYQFDTITETVPIDVTHDEHPIVNSARQPLDPPLQAEQKSLLIRIRRIHAYATRQWKTVRASHLNKVNSDAVTIAGVSYAAGQVRCVECKPEGEQKVGDTHYQWLIELEARESDVYDNPHDARVLDQGFVKAVAAGEYANIVDKLHEPITTPQLLDGRGGIKGGAAGPYATDPPGSLQVVNGTNASYIDWPRYKRATFTGTFDDTTMDGAI